MKTVFLNGTVVNVFTDELEKTNVLIGDGKIIGVDPSYTAADADEAVDVSGKYICPGFIDGHIHIESTTLLPAEMAKVCAAHGTTGVITDPHEIANVCGTDGIRYMLAASEGLPVTVYVMLPSCVPSTPFDESGAELHAEDLRSLYDHPRVLGLAEMMNFPGVINRDPIVMDKLKDANELNVVINGHAPLLSGKALDAYIAAGVSDDHECSNEEEAKERIRKGQLLMIREGTSARNLDGLLGMFDEPWNRHCMLVTDDKHPLDLLTNGHIDSIIRAAGQKGKSVIVGIRMATIQAARYYRLFDKGAIAPGYAADLLVLDDLQSVKVGKVYKDGKAVAENGKTLPFEAPVIPDELKSVPRGTFHAGTLSEKDFEIAPESEQCRVIRVIPGQLLTDEQITKIDWEKNNGLDLGRDILKLAVIERHHGTGHIGLGFISGIGLKRGAIASSVAHDHHNLIVIGTNEADMAAAANYIQSIGGGMAVVTDGKVEGVLPLPIAGLMSEGSAEEVSEQNEKIRSLAHANGAPKDIEPFMNMAFVSLSVIPHLKMNTRGLVDVDAMEMKPLYV